MQIKLFAIYIEFNYAFCKNISLNIILVAKQAGKSDIGCSVC